MHIEGIFENNNDNVAFKGLGLVPRLAHLIAHPDTESVEQICDALDLSHARLLRICRREFGYSPKMLLRRARFAGMLVELQRKPYREWRVFLDPRYVDQSHFIRDFQFFLGMAPTRFLSLSDESQAELAAPFTGQEERALAA